MQQPLRADAYYWFITASLDTVHTYTLRQTCTCGAVYLHAQECPMSIDALKDDFGLLFNISLPPCTPAGTYPHAEKTYTPGAHAEQYKIRWL